MMSVPWKLWEGQVVDLSFPLLRYLGGTGRSAVYLTQIGDSQPRNAAIKLILADTPEADPSANWERVARLSHPNLLSLLRTGKWEMNQLSLRYAVMDYAEENLASVLVERPLDPGEARELLKPLIDAVVYIHDEGLVHGHVKPSNILAIGDDLKLAVDGVSLVGELVPIPAAPGPYDPPELAERGYSPVGDVWSVGVTLVEVLTQRVPSCSGPKQDPILLDGIPADFLPMVRACLRADPRRRPALREVAALFGRKEPQPSEALVVVKPPEKSRKWLSVALVGGGAVLLAGVLAGPSLLHRAPSQQPAAAPVAGAQPQAVKPEETPSAPAPADPEPAPSAPKTDAVQAAETAPTPAPESMSVPPAVPAPAPRSKKAAAVPAAPGDVVQQVMPDVPAYARRTIHGKVKIQVRATVDDSGHVTGATVESQNSKYFAKLAQEAARKWEFSGAGEWLLRFEFTNSGSTVNPSRVTR